MNDRQTYCCASYVGTSQERLATTLCGMAEAWYAQHPIAVGCSAKEARHHQHECEQAVQADYFERQAEIEQACGFFEPITILSIIVTLIRLFYDWTHQREP